MGFAGFARFKGFAGFKGFEGCSGFAGLAGFPGVKDGERLEADRHVGELVAFECAAAAGIGDAAGVGCT